MNSALTYHANLLHSRAEDGFDPRAARLRATIYSSTCQPHPDGGWMLWCRVRLSDGANYRLCWKSESPDLLGVGMTVWKRVQWSEGYNARKPPRGSKKRSS